MALGFILTGYYLNLIVITSLILIHELGHYLTAKILKFRVDKIIIYPFGGLTKINDLINKNINEELLIASAGVIVQFLFYLLIVYLNKLGVIREYTLNLYTIYNREIIFFNLLPIYPLDGSKIFNLLFSEIVPYKLANKLTVLLSIIFLVLLFWVDIYNYNYSYFMIIGVLLTYLVKFIKELKYIYNKFLLERYLYNIKYSRNKIINNYHKMYKNANHIFKINNGYMNEKKYLAKYYFR
jgi:stage IV sporulation protein FB